MFTTSWPPFAQGGRYNVDQLRAFVDNADGGEAASFGRSDDKLAQRPPRELLLTPASAIAPRPVRWLWADRLPLGALTVAAGREGTGKSQFAT